MAIVTPIDSPPGAPRRLRISSPATLETLGEIEVQGADEVTAAVETARKAQIDWARRSFDDRARIVQRAVSVLIERQERFIDSDREECKLRRTTNGETLN